MMNVFIVEDEPLAVAQLSTLLSALRPGTQVVGACDTIQSAVNWINENPAPDLAFFDIQLGDGLSFDIFTQVNFEVPVIFTTAFNEYAIQAFKVNSVDYLLKPLGENDLEQALQKYERHQVVGVHSVSTVLIDQIQKALGHREFKKRFLIRIGTRLRTVDISEVLYFYSFDKATYLKDSDGKNHLLDQTLETIEQLIDPAAFFRINRKYLVQIHAINEVFTFSNSRFKLKVTHADEDDFLVAREKAKAFKSWLEGETF